MDFKDNGTEVLYMCSSSQSCYSYVHSYPTNHRGFLSKSTRHYFPHEFGGVYQHYNSHKLGRDGCVVVSRQRSSLLAIFV